MTRRDDEIPLIPSAGSAVYGPCPVCDAWQIEVPASLDPFEAAVAVDEAIREHDAADHPGELARVTREQRLRNASARLGFPTAVGVDAAVLILRYFDTHDGAWAAFDSVRYTAEGADAWERLRRSIDLWSDGRLCELLAEAAAAFGGALEAWALCLGVAAGYHLDRDLTGNPSLRADGSP